MNRSDIANEESKARISNTKILVVDDDSLNLRLIDSYLKELGFKNVSVVNNGINAIRKLQMKFDLIILDIGLPDINGIELCIHIRKLPHGINVPIIAITGFDEEINEKCIAAGMNTVIKKPITLITLKNTINQYI